MPDVLNPLPTEDNGGPPPRGLSDPLPYLAPDPPEAVDAKQIVDTFRAKIEASIKNRRKFSPDWQANIALRIGDAPTDAGDNQIDEEQSTVNPDWSLTKTKIANLYSQVPAVQVTHENAQYAAAIPPFAKALNYELGEKRANVGVAMEEVLNDVVNAAGLGAVMVGYAARFETVMLPVEETIPGPAGPIQTKGIPEATLQQMAQQGLVHLQPTQRVVDYKFTVDRLSPGSVLWPAEFRGSHFANADWMGYTGELTEGDAVPEFHLTASQIEQVLRSSNISSEDDLRRYPERATLSARKVVRYHDLYYWRHRVDPKELSFSAIWRLVFVEGLEEPVIHEPWKGQRYDPQTRRYVGNTTFPIAVLTLTYISDNPIVPSDSAACRPQVNDMRRSRSQMFMNRERSLPMRWINTNRIDSDIVAIIQRGRWQGLIPVIGRGDDAMGETARASYPAEDRTFDHDNKSDMLEAWGIGPNQQGMTTSGATAKEVGITQQNFSTRIGQDKAKVSKFFLTICELLAGWMALYSDFPTLTVQERQVMHGAWDEQRILHDLVLKIRPDASIAIDVNGRIKQLMQFINMVAKSGFVDMLDVYRELTELHNLDPTNSVKRPEPQLEEPNISLRLSGKEDLINPLAMAMLLKKKIAPTVEEVEAAKKILVAAAMPPAPEPAGSPPKPPAPTSVPQPPDDYSLADKVAKRSRDIGGG